MSSPRTISIRTRSATSRNSASRTSCSRWTNAWRARCGCGSPRSPRSNERIVLNVTHSLQHIDLYDSVIILYQGQLVYHGGPKFIAHYFGITNPTDLYPRLAKRKAAEWHNSWQKYRASYYEQSRLPA